MSAPIPVSIITGFLGAGKTTLLNCLLSNADMSNAAVVVNEFGEVGIDHLLVETADDNVFEMASGCLCCTIRGDLVDTLISLIERRDAKNIKAFDRVVIETTGLADPAPVLHTIMNHPFLLQRYKLEGVVSVIDAVNGDETLNNHPEAVKQVAVADRLVLTKADLLTGKQGEDKLFAIITRLKNLNKGARMLEATTGEANPQNLFNTGLYDPATKSNNVERWLAADAHDKPSKHHHAHHDHVHHNDDHHHNVNRHDKHIESFTVTSEKAITKWNLDLFLELLRSYHGPNLLRVKGIIKVQEEPDKPVVIHGVQHIFHPPVQLNEWPDDDKTSRIVFITKDIKRAQLSELFKAFTDPVRGGADAFRDDTLSLKTGD